MTDSIQILWGIARSFPVLAENLKSEESFGDGSLGDLDHPVDMNQFVDWITNEASPSAYWAGVFVLSLWNPRALDHYGLKQFDLHRALDVWDNRQKEAFAIWSSSGFWRA